jgi:DHA2 family multidrug resistance protein-like MFS transporter
MPAQKAGSASAINQMTRQLGQALGVAIVGSIAASAYTSGFDAGRAPGVPRAALAAARDSITGALSAARDLSGGARAAVLDAAHGAFIHGMHVALVVTASIAVLGALYAAKVIPSGQHATEDEIAEHQVELGELVID